MKKTLFPSLSAVRPKRADLSLPWSWLFGLSLSALALTALLLRLWTLDHALPFVDHPDEPVHIDLAASMLVTGDPNPQWFWKPSFHTYLLLAAFQAHYGWGQAAGIYGPLDQLVLTTHTVTTVPGFFVIGRQLSALFGAMTVLAAYSLGQRGWGRGAGLAGAILVVVLPWHLRFSQWATTDILATLMATLSLGAALLALHHGRWQAYLVAGAFAGLAASTKYNAGIVAGAITTVALVRAWQGLRTGAGWIVLRTELGRLILAGLAAMVGFVAGTPYALLSWQQVSGGIGEQWGNYGGGNGHYRGAWNVAGYVEFFWGWGLGWFACLLVGAGLIVLARQRPTVLVVWLGFALPSLLLHLSRPTHFMQNMLPLLVACSLPIGVALIELPRLLTQRQPGLRSPLSLGLALALTLPLLISSLNELQRQAAGDSRQQLVAWVDAEVPPGSRIAAELKPIPDPQEARWSEFERLDLHDLAWYRAQGYAYLVGSSARWRQLEPPASYAELLAQPVISFGPQLNRDEQTGPRLVVVATGLSAADVPQPLAAPTRVGGARLLGVALGDPSGPGSPPALRPEVPLRPGGVLGLRTFWQVKEPLGEDYFIFVHLIDANGGRPTQRDTPPWQGRFPTSSWQPGSLVVDVNDLYLPPGLLPGEYRLLVGMYHPETWARPLVTTNGVPVPDGAVEVARVIIAP
ncbi:MAG: glycosyltransferase family 39 protein [Oscillochloridaceae bacterium umkhey_bin13]